ncbi:MAG: TrbG/VirB9 family P-type conjugative transfer protein [Alphaproteobacteria bacterium]|nr:TrbG/VirB9 family P-type conjugative transfer protein [Alphaproteobacteria bacterium]
MTKKNMHKMNWLGAVAVSVLMATGAMAQQMLPTDTEAAQLEDAIAQTTGEFDQMNLGYIHSLGMQQKAWNDPLSHMGEGQLKPGYSRYNWSPDVVLPIRLREGMMTLINLPTWELIEKVHIGSPESFGGEIAAPNSLLLYADPSYIGVDCNMIVFGRSGNRYVFYLRSETYNTDKITQSVVDVLVGQRYTPVSAGGSLGSYNGASVTMSSAMASGFSSAPGWAGQSNLVPGGAQNPQIGLNTASTGPKDWLASIPVDPESFRFDIDMYLPNPSDIDIAPDNVWRDNIFTYIDLGPKALTMTQRPIVNLIVEDSEVPVGFRTRGPNSRLIVVEGIGDMVLRNGKKLICLKLRRDPATGLEWTDYSADSARPERWNAPHLPDNYGAGDGAMSIDALLARKQTALNMDGEPINGGAGYGSDADGRGNGRGCCDAGRCPDGEYEYCDQQPQHGATNGNAYQAVAGDQMAPMQTIPPAVLQSQAARAGIDNVMGDITLSGNTAVSPMSAGYQDASVKPVSAGVRNRRVTTTTTESIAVELGANPNIAALESEWDNIYGKNEDLLKGYEPYYSIDATADGDVRELFRLRVGPVKSIKAGDTLCRKLGRRGFSCSVVRIQ